jgi:GTP pyrophosphokinase
VTVSIASLKELLKNRVRGVNPRIDWPVVERAFELACHAHRRQHRRSGELYASHPVEVCLILADLLERDADEKIIASALLHDAVEDTDVTLKDIEKVFGSEITALVDGVTKVSGLSFVSRESEQAENFRKMLFSMVRDVRVILIKLADRLHNMRTLDAMNPEEIRNTALETQEIYAPLAHRLGIARIKWELEDLALKYLEPDAYRELVDRVAVRREEREAYLEEVVGPIQKKMTHMGIKAEVIGRPKHFASIWKKMHVQKREFEDIYDLLGIRIVATDKTDCYRILGLIHDLFMPVHDRFKDYIATPKSNMYQSLHTTVIGPRGEMVEIQIRTKRMNLIAERGVAAHYMYKEGGRLDREIARKLGGFMGNEADWQREAADPAEFMDFLRTSLYQDEVFVFTPRGELKQLPRGSVPLDFAYLVHTEVGNHYTGARVNGVIVSKEYQLRSGDSVEILTTPKGRPTEEWLKLVKTSSAKAKIRRWIRDQRLHDSITLGKQLLAKALRKDKTKFPADRELTDIAQAMGLQNGEQLLAQVGQGLVSSKQVHDRIVPEQASQGLQLGFLRRLKPAPRKSSGVVVQGLDNLMINLAKCCRPIPGDRIVGMVTRGRGISVHRTDCPNALGKDVPAERLVEVQWDTDEREFFATKLVVLGSDRRSLLADISNAIAATGTNIRTATIEGSEGRAKGTFLVEVTNLRGLNELIKNIQGVKGVSGVWRDRVRAGGKKRWEVWRKEVG